MTKPAPPVIDTYKLYTPCDVEVPGDYPNTANLIFYTWHTRAEGELHTANVHNWMDYFFIDPVARLSGDTHPYVCLAYSINRHD